MEDHHPPISEDRLFFFDMQEIILDALDASGFILDIGGGGEGVIGRLKGSQVVAIDRNRRELEEAASGPLKIVMDGTDLQFLDGTFATVTAFYTLMYIKENSARQQLFEEVYRVLTPGGHFLIWDAVIPPRGEAEQDIAVFPLTIKLPDGEIQTGYGTPWPQAGRAAAHYGALAESTGFQVDLLQEQGLRFFLRLTKGEHAD